MNSSRKLASVSASAGDARSAGSRSRVLRQIALSILAFVTLRWALLSAAGIAILTYTAFGFYFVPRIARAQLQGYVADTLQQKLSIGDIRFNPFTFEASISALELTGSDDSLLVAFRHLYVDAELASLWRRAVVLKEVQLAAPDIRALIAPDASVNLAKLLPASGKQSAFAPPRVHIARLAVDEGRLSVEDRTRSEPFTAVIALIRFTLTDFRTDIGHRNAYHFAGTTAAGETLEWSGGFTVHPLGSQGEFNVERAQAATIDAYLQEALPFRLISGIVSLRGSYNFRVEPLALDVTLPIVAASDLSITERIRSAEDSNRERAVIDIPEIAADDITFAYPTRAVALRRLDIKRARMDVRRDADGSINMARLLGPAGSNAGGQAVPGMPAPSADSTRVPHAPDPSRWNIGVAMIHLDEASIAVEDRTVAPVARLEAALASLTVSGWSTADDAELGIDADVTIGKGGKLRARGTLKIEPLQAALAVEVTALDLPFTQPYLRQVAALTLHSGQLSARGDLVFSSPLESNPSFAFDGACKSTTCVRRTTW